MIGIPTTAGTGSDAQSYAVLSDARTHVKMACGDPGAAFRIALLDPALTVSQPAGVTAASGYDALSHAIEAFVTTARTPLSQTFAREAFRLVRGQLAHVLQQPDDLEARGAMLLGSHLAGLAIEHSMLGAGHACANPLTAQFDVTHGIAVSLMLPHVVRWNAEAVGPLYADLLDGPGSPGSARRRAAGRRAGAGRGDLRLPAAAWPTPASREDALPALAEAAAAQWTGGFNPRPLTRESALALYRRRLGPLSTHYAVRWRWSSSGRTAAPGPGCDTRSSSCSPRSAARSAMTWSTGALTSRRDLADFLDRPPVVRCRRGRSSTPASPPSSTATGAAHFAGRLQGRGLELGPLHRPIPAASPACR